LDVVSRANVAEQNVERFGDWMQTTNGRQFWPLDPRADEIHLDDVAHALSNLCRFAGHCRKHYSVAEHSVRVSWLAERLVLRTDAAAEDTRAAALLGLLHDAAEAYLVDLPRPVKKYIEEYATHERRLENVIADRFELDGRWWPVVHEADEVLLATEKRDLMAEEPASWGLRHAPLDDRIEPWSANEAEQRFLLRFRALVRS